MLYIKDGVKPKNLVIAAAIANIGQTLKLDLTITSGTDGTHMRGSKHYEGEALDLRIRNLSKDKITDIVDRLSDKLGEDYQVILEIDHIHIEYDPSRH